MDLLIFQSCSGKNELFFKKRVKKTKQQLIIGHVGRVSNKINANFPMQTALNSEFLA